MKKLTWFIVMACLVPVALSVIAVRYRETTQAPATQKTVATAQLSYPMVQMLPSQTLVYMAINNLTASKDHAKETINYRAIQFFTQKDVLRKLARIFQQASPKGRGAPDLETMVETFDLDGECRKALGMSLQELIDIFYGEIAFALIDVRLAGRGNPEVDLLFKIDVKDEQKVLKILSTIAGPEEWNKTTRYKMTNPEATVYKEDVNSEQGPCFVIHHNSFIFAMNKTTIEKAVRISSGTASPENSLLDHPAYKKIIAKTNGTDADVFMYWNWEGIYKLPILKDIPFDLKSLSETVGLETAKASGAATAVRDGRFYDRTYLYAPGEKKGLLHALATPRLNDPDGILLTSESDMPSFLGGGPAGLAIIAAIAIPNLITGKIAANEASAMAALMLLVSQEAVWRQTDTDGNGVKDYWVADMSCFYRFLRADGRTKVNYIDISIAKADAAPFSKNNTNPIRTAGVNIPDVEDWSKVVPVPKSGYFFRVMQKDEEDIPYAQTTVGDNNIRVGNQTKFAFVAYPAEYPKSGKQTFIINEAGTVYSKDTRGQPVLQWPAEDPCTAGWAEAE